MTKLSFGCVLLLCATAWAADTVPLDVKAGLWETTVNLERSGVPPIPPEALARLTPEQRARVEEKMKGSQASKATVHKHCVTKEELNKPLSFGADDKSCHRTILSSSASKQEFRMECTMGGMKQSGTFRVEALNSESVKGSVQMTAGDGTRTMNINSTFAAKWIGAVCDSKEH